MLFSVVVPIYKVEKYLRQCIDSILTQNFLDFELILVDDGSPDNSPKICDEYAKIDERVKVVHKQNGGLVSARKAGVAIAKGEYIVNVDGDDYIKQGYLLEFANAIDQYGVDIACVNCFKVIDGQEIDKVESVNFSGFFDKTKIEKELFPFLIEDINGASLQSAVCLKAFRKNLIKPVLDSIDNSVVMGEDYACAKPCVYLCHSIYFSDKYLYGYRDNPTSITKSKCSYDIYGPLTRAKILEKYIDMSQGDFKEQLYRITVHSLFNASRSQFYRNEKSKVIKSELIKALEHPFYAQAINNCKTNNKKLKLARFALKHKSFFLMKLYNKLKKN